MSKLKDLNEVEDTKYDVLDSERMAEYFNMKVGAFRTAKSREADYIPEPSFYRGTVPMWLGSDVISHLKNMKKRKSQRKQQETRGRKRNVPELRVSS